MADLKDGACLGGLEDGEEATTSAFLGGASCFGGCMVDEVSKCASLGRGDDGGCISEDGSTWGCLNGASRSASSLAVLSIFADPVR